MRVANTSFTAEEHRRTDLQLWAASLGASTWMIDLEAYQRCRVAGLAERLIIDPVEGHIEAIVTDGTDTIAARWSIRRPTPQLAIAPGRGVLLEGVSMVEAGAYVLVDPTFQVVAYPTVA